MENFAKTIILGAGASGLISARLLNNAGRTTIVLEQSRGVGGRMATRRFGGGVFDHGAQFFTVRDAKFQPWVDQWIHENVIQIWSLGFSQSGEKVSEDGHPRYQGTTGMTAAPKNLANGLDIRLNTKVNSISIEEDLWVARTIHGEKFTGRSMILTAPVRQSLALLNAGGVSLPVGKLQQLQVIDYDPCIALLALVDGGSRIPSPGGIQFSDGPIRWMADNSQKGISPTAPAITIHANATFSRQYFNKEPKHIAEKLLEAAKPWLGQGIRDWQIQKWRFSQPVNIFPERFLEVPGSPKLFFAGDAFGGPRVEGAVLSGIAVAEHILKAIG